MRKAVTFLIFGCILCAMSCTSNSELEDHELVGNYLGSWESVVQIESRLSIEYDEKRDGLVLFFTLADSLELNILSDTEFSIDRYESNGYSNGVTGYIVSDTLYMENEVYLVSDQMNTSTTRKGAFVRQ